MKEKNVYDVLIQNQAFGGDGFGRLPDGKAVFVPFTISGELVQIRLVEEKKYFARGELLRVLQENEKRVIPRCSHFMVCGGCHYQHMPYAEQLVVKESVLIEQLQRIGGIDNPPVEKIVPSPTPWNYRNAIQFHLSHNGSPGFYIGKSHDVVEIKECHLPLPEINEIWPQLDFESEPSIHRIGLVNGADEETLLVLESDDLPPELSVDLPVSIVHRSQEGDLILAGNAYVLMKVKERVFSVSAGSFFQVNQALAELMVDRIILEMKPSSHQVVMDLYCGVGLFSAFIAPFVESVIGVELSESACQDYTINLDEFEHVSLYEGQVETILPDLQFQPDLIIVDPPRAGLDRVVVDEIVRLAPDRIAYISCDPSTLARDLKRLLQKGYQLEKIIPFDFFPQTYHIETLTFLKYG